MKNVINYFYNMNIDNIRMIDDNYYFIFQDNDFIFQRINDFRFDFNAIYILNKILLNNNGAFYRIILNKDNQILTVTNNQRYILLMSNLNIDKKIDFYDLLDTNIPIDNNIKEIMSLNRFKWVELWSSKIDYFEIYINHNIHNYNLLNKYANYFIGLGENAINYVNNTINSFKPTNYDKLVVSHKRINVNTSLKDLYNPIYLVLDHQTRDISEYLKMLFLSSKYKRSDIYSYINEISLSNYGAGLLMARMLFPSFFFDKFELLVENKISERECLKIIDRMNEYEEYIYYIYKVLRNKYDIFEIEWLKKVDYSSTFTTPKTSGTSFISMDSIPSFSVTSIMLQ